MAILRSDSATRADGPIGTPSDGGSAWQSMVGSWVISSNAIMCGGVTAHAITVLESGASDVLIEADIVHPVGNAGMVARVLDENNHILLVIASSFAQLYQWRGGALDAITGIVAVSWSATARWGLKVEGTAISVFVNGVQQTGLNSSVLTATTHTKHGLRAFNDASSRFWNVEIESLGAPPIVVDVTPEPATVTTSGTVQFSVSVTNATNTAVTWSVQSGGGSINSSGLYTAPGSAGSATIRATSVEDNTKFDDVAVTINAPASVVDPHVSFGSTSPFIRFGA